MLKNNKAIKTILLTFLMSFLFLIISIHPIMAEKAWWDPTSEGETWYNPWSWQGSQPDRHTFRDYILPNIEVFNVERGTGPYAPYQDRHPALIIIGIINIALTFLGIVFIALTVYAGFLFLFAQGNKDNITKALNIIKNSVIGLAIVLATYALTSFIFQSIFKALA